MGNDSAMAKKKVIIGVKLFFATPPSVAAAGATGSLADRIVERSASGQYIIPGSQLKGKLRHACEQLLRALESPGERLVCESPRAETMCPHLKTKKTPCPVCAIFGNPSWPSPLRFHDLTAVLADRSKGRDLDDYDIAPSLRAMATLNRRRMTAADDKLFLVETAPYLRDLAFNNDRAITGSLLSAAQAKLLLGGLKLIKNWGGLKSRGTGWTVAAEAVAMFGDSDVEEGGWREITDLWKD